MAEGNEAQSLGSPVTRGKRFLSESVEELKKVSFPTRQETMQATFVTILIVVFMAFCLFVLDQIFHTLMGAIIRP